MAHGISLLLCRESHFVRPAILILIITIRWAEWPSIYVVILFLICTPGVRVAGQHIHAQANYMQVAICALI